MKKNTELKNLIKYFYLGVILIIIFMVFSCLSLQAGENTHYKITGQRGEKISQESIKSSCINLFDMI